MIKKLGKIYVLGTPIGNLEDITLRGLNILKECDLIISETPRTTLKLLNHYGINKSVWQFFQNPKKEQIESIYKRLEEGKNIVLVSEAGSPGIADPGGKVIEEILKINKDVLIVPIPGACAIASAISISGLKSQEFVFLGFVPKTKKNKFYEKINEFDGLVVFYESPFRIRKTLLEISEKVKNKKHVVICRELTKIFEEIIRLNFEDLKIESQKIKQKGEFTILIN